MSGNNFNSPAGPGWDPTPAGQGWDPASQGNEPTQPLPPQPSYGQTAGNASYPNQPGYPPAGYPQQPTQGQQQPPGNSQQPAQAYAAANYQQPTKKGGGCLIIGLLIVIFLLLATVLLFIFKPWDDSTSSTTQQTTAQETQAVTPAVTPQVTPTVTPAETPAVTPTTQPSPTETTNTATPTPEPTAAPTPQENTGVAPPLPDKVPGGWAKLPGGDVSKIEGSLDAAVYLKELKVIAVGYLNVPGTDVDAVASEFTQKQSIGAAICGIENGTSVCAAKAYEGVIYVVDGTTDMPVTDVAEFTHELLKEWK